VKKTIKWVLLCVTVLTSVSLVTCSDNDKDTPGYDKESPDDQDNPDNGSNAFVGIWENDEEKEAYQFMADGTGFIHYYFIYDDWIVSDPITYTYDADNETLYIDGAYSYPAIWNVISLTNNKLVVKDEHEQLSYTKRNNLSFIDEWGSKRSFVGTWRHDIKDNYGGYETLTLSADESFFFMESDGNKTITQRGEYDYSYPDGIMILRLTFFDDHHDFDKQERFMIVSLTDDEMVWRSLEDSGSDNTITWNRVQIH